MSIQKMRLQRGWSQQQLADASGLSVRTVQRIESGHPGSIESIKSLAAVFEVDFSTLTSEAAMVDQQQSVQSSQSVNEAIRERIAFLQVRRIRAFYLHLTTYLAVNAGCALIDALTSPGVWWFIGLSLFWGLGLAIHALTVFAFDRYFGGPWELERVEKLLGRPLQG